MVSGRVFVGSDIGYVYSLDAKSGCVYWSYQTKGSVRNAISLGPVKTAIRAKYAVYFGDAHANVYAVDAQTGAELWIKKIDDHFAARVTAAPTLYDGRLYVGVSSSEEFSAATPDYPCCTSRGSVVALNASTGRASLEDLRGPETPKPTRKNSKGVQLYAPAGGSVWNSPTIDQKRKAVYFGTGDSETEPAAKTSDSIMAVDMNTGKMLWHLSGAGRRRLLEHLLSRTRPTIARKRTSAGSRHRQFAGAAHALERQERGGGGNQGR